MGTTWKRWWPLVKIALTAVVVAAVGWVFYRDLRDPRLWERSFSPAWLIASGLLYLMGLAFWCLYWRRLLVRLGQRPATPALIRAYYVSHLGKYVPGKAWTLFLRAGLIKGPNVSAGLAGMTAFYEVLTTMASGALLAAILFAVFGRESSAGLDWSGLWAVLTGDKLAEGFVLGRWTATALAVLLFLVVGLPLLPPLFNRVANRMSLPFRGQDASPLPAVSTAALLEGFAVTAVGWVLLAASFWATLQAATGGQLPWTTELIARATAALGLVYVAGFLLLIAPAGLGVREFLLTLLLTPELAPALEMDREEARGLVVIAVLGLRLTWTVAEVVAAACVWWLPVERDKA